MRIRFVSCSLLIVLYFVEFVFCCCWPTGSKWLAVRKPHLISQMAAYPFVDVEN